MPGLLPAETSGSLFIYAYAMLPPASPCNGVMTAVWLRPIIRLCY